MSNVLVVGAKGAIGGLILSDLRERGVSVRAATRNMATANFLDGVQTVEMDLTKPQTLAPALEGIDKVFLYAEAAGAEAFAAAASAAGVKYVVLLSSQSAAEVDWKSNFNARRHCEMELPLEASGMDWTFLRPGGFASNALLWASTIREGRFVPLPHPESQIPPVHEQEIADVALKALLTDTLNGCAPMLTGPRSITQREMVQTIATAINTDIRIEDLTPSDARQMFSQHIPEVYVDVLLASLAKHDGVPDMVTAEIPNVLGRPARDFEAWVHEKVEYFAWPALRRFVVQAADNGS
jgi:uncharacterized protein YbjT (DUF2867 family)